MNIANQFTVLRIILSFVCMWLIARDTVSSLSAAFVVFLVASVTDFLDGFIARKKEMVSDLGKILDPIADKILILGIFLAFLERGAINIWMVALIMLREFIITAVRLFILNKGVVLEARFLGKNKTVSQMVGITIIFITIISFKVYPGNKASHFFYYTVIPYMMWYIVAITLFSGVHYLWVNRKLIKTF